MNTEWDIVYPKIESNVFFFIKCHIYRIKENLQEGYWKVVWLRDTDDWYEQMGKNKNLSRIEYLAVSAEFEDYIQMICKINIYFG